MHLIKLNWDKEIVHGLAYECKQFNNRKQHFHVAI